MKVQAIIPSAGTGTRLKASKHKPFVEINGVPLIAYTLIAFEESNLVNSVIVVAHKDAIKDIEDIVADQKFKKVAQVVEGGATRCESVFCGLAQVEKETDVVVVHDGARALVTPEIIDGAVSLCESQGSVVVAVPVKSTIKQVDQKQLTITKTLDRASLWEIQTPQVFKRDVLIKAHEQSVEATPTDDAMLVEMMGETVKIFQGDYRNIKVTTQEDLIVAKAFLDAR